ncbi:KGK domain-containing protein [Limnoraphis robusta]|uniref:KGK domain-containing protein n=1 Tax=Limnoraphis robusta CCNP1315 TaxID=3110306 RepID=A0ABU5TWH3_9CYAN|nr:KGK domain-containing protein [Limnoraphis robusta]MEA5519249.1 KGK domain-containing protein [Limnoraphis robusta CCNP1315]MEA5543632.1 KGK domain-containing protein [Limnoraphis robusta CCNP1324]
MEDNITLQNCGENDVISFENESYRVSNFSDKVIGTLTAESSNYFVNYLVSKGVQKAEIKHSDELKYPNGEWFNNGKECEILKLGSKGWQKGKVRFKVIVEFCPDEPEVSEPESPLDSLRQKLMESETEHN